MTVMMKKIPRADVWALGTTRLFGNHDLGRSGLITGWSEPEDMHVWNNGPEAVLHALIEPTTRAISVKLEGIPFLDGSVPQQELTLFVNGARLGFWRLAERRSYTLEAMIEPEHIFTREAHCLLACAFHVPKSAKPSDLGLGSDGRELGFCFQSICFA